MVGKRLPSGLASRTGFFRFHTYRLLPFVIPLNVGNSLFSRASDMVSYQVRVLTLEPFTFRARIHIHDCSMPPVPKEFCAKLHDR